MNENKRKEVIQKELVKTLKYVKKSAEEHINSLVDEGISKKRAQSSLFYKVKNNNKRNYEYLRGLVNLSIRKKYAPARLFIPFINIIDSDIALYGMWLSMCLSENKADDEETFFNYYENLSEEELVSYKNKRRGLVKYINEECAD